jgi:WS/DGAT/MGAT family acyltransferase
LEDDQWAMVAKVHHAMVDGVSGSELLAVMMDVTPEPTPGVEDTWEPEPEPTSTALATQAVTDSLKSPYEQFRAARATTRVPRQMLQQLGETAKGVSSAAGVLKPTPTTSINGPIGPHRRWDYAETDVDEIKLIRKNLEGSFNDVILAGATAGFRALLQSRNEELDVIRTLVPVSVRPRDERGMAVGDGSLDNQVSAMFAELPVGVDDPLDRLRTISEQMTGLKESKQAVAGEVLTSLSGFAPPALLALGTRLGAKAPQRALNTVTTNVPGPQFPLYTLGRRMLRVYPFVPLGAQIRIGIAIFSYNGTVNYGVTGDYDTAPDIGVLCRGIEDGIRELLALSGA